MWARVCACQMQYSCQKLRPGFSSWIWAQLQPLHTALCQWMWSSRPQAPIRLQAARLLRQGTVVVWLAPQHCLCSQRLSPI